MKRAFTLIELLVVIAIIAILAAILFPVFAQAKLSAKKTVCLSNTKQYATSINIYLSDTDDTMPNAFGQREPGTDTFMINVSTPYPADALNTAPWNTDFRRAQAGNMVANSVQPYMKSLSLQEVPTATVLPVTTETPNPSAPVATAALTYNGFLHDYSATAVTAPSSCPLVWTGLGNGSPKYRAVASPTLQCDQPNTNGAKPCMFNPTALPQTGAGGTWNWTGVGGGSYTKAAPYGNRGIVARVDSSAKSLPIGANQGDINVSPGAGTAAQGYSDPFQKVGLGGDITQGAYIIQCTSPGATVSYWCYFRPDREQ